MSKDYPAPLDAWIPPPYLSAMSHPSKAAVLRTPEDAGFAVPPPARGVGTVAQAPARSLEEFIGSPDFCDAVLEALRQGAREAEEEQRRMDRSATSRT